MEPTEQQERRRRHIGVLIGAVIGFVFLAIVASGFDLPDAESGTATSDLQPGDCFTYPGDGAQPSSVITVDCAQVHYAEVFATTGAGDTDSCVPLFETYTGVPNYWETEYIIGFLEVSDTSMLCYLYAEEDFAGSLRS